MAEGDLCLGCSSHVLVYVHVQLTVYNDTHLSWARKQLIHIYSDTY